jgi:hypothetical protein
MLKGDLRHLGEILVEETGQILRLEIVGDLGEILDIAEKDGELLALRLERDRMLAGKDRLVDLWRQVF